MPGAGQLTASPREDKPCFFKNLFGMKSAKSPGTGRAGGTGGAGPAAWTTPSAPSSIEWEAQAPEGAAAPYSETRRRNQSNLTVGAPADERRRQRSDAAAAASAAVAAEAAGLRRSARLSSRGPTLVCEFPAAASGRRGSVQPPAQHGPSRLSAAVTAAAAATMAQAAAEARRGSNLAPGNNSSDAHMTDVDEAEAEADAQLVADISAGAEASAQAQARDAAAAHAAAAALRAAQEAEQAAAAGAAAPATGVDAPAGPQPVWQAPEAAAKGPTQCSDPYKGLDPQVAHASAVVLKQACRTLAEHVLMPPAMRRLEWGLEQFKVDRCLHQGYASSVYSGVCRLSGVRVALKLYDVLVLSSLNRYQLLREVKLHASLSHQNVVTLYAAFQDGKHVCLVQEFCEGGNLLGMLRAQGGRLGERSAVRLVVQPLLSVLTYLHSRGITHRDIKPENLLLDAEATLKLADFGLAIDLTRERAVTRAGTTDYMAPEVLACPLKAGPESGKDLACHYYDETVDSWSVGVMAYELLVGFPPFRGGTKQQTIANIRDRCLYFPKRQPLTEEAIDYIELSLEVDKSRRLTALELQHHPWIMARKRRGSHEGSSSGSGSGSSERARGPAAAAPAPLALLAARGRAAADLAAAQSGQAAEVAAAAAATARATAAGLQAMDTAVGAAEGRTRAHMKAPQQAQMCPF